MAISKTQNERPAIIELIDDCNELQTAVNSHTTSIEEVSLGLDAVQGQIGSGFSSSNTVAQAIADANDTIQSTSTELNDFVDRFRFEVTDELEIVASATTQVTGTFSTPYEDGSQIAVFPAFIESYPLGTFEVAVNAVTNEGFTLGVHNSGTSDGSVIIGILAVRMN